MAAPLILFGAFDRHNFGDLLLAHVAEAQAREIHGERPLVFAGVAARDMRPYGGHRVSALADLARNWDDQPWGDQPAEVWHVGGELLTCSLYEAAVMVQSAEGAREAIKRYDGVPSDAQAWAEQETALHQLAGYLASKRLFTRPGPFRCQAVGGVDLAGLPAAFQSEVLARLMEADRFSVRDRTTQAFLATQGIDADLEPDPAEQVAARFGRFIAHHAEGSVIRAVEDRFPQGYLALQFSADYGDDITLDTLARQLDVFAKETGWGICLFRAGAAPWHDDEEVYRRFMAKLSSTPAMVFASLHLWDICALLARAQGYCGTSLHGRLVSRAFGVPGINLEQENRPRISKVRAYSITWWPDDPQPATPSWLCPALLAALDQ